MMSTQVWRCVESSFRFWIFIRQYENNMEIKVPLSSVDWWTSYIKLLRFAKFQLLALAHYQLPVNISVMFVSPIVGADYTHCSAWLGNKALERYQVLQRDECKEEIEFQRCFDCTLLFENPVYRKLIQAADRLVDIFKKSGSLEVSYLTVFSIPKCSLVFHLCLFASQDSIYDGVSCTNTKLLL